MSFLPPFITTSDMVNLVAEIAELIASLGVGGDRRKTSMLHRANRIRSVHSSVRIEGNELSLDETIAVLNGKRVVAPAHQVREIQNAYDAYELIDQLDWLSLDDLLRAHGVMMKGLTPDAGALRRVEVGVYAGFRLVHAGVEAVNVREAMEELFAWLRESRDHPLIKAGFFHCAFECIHPFSDGNGRMGRLWHTLILSSWKPELSWMPVESMVDGRVGEYYQVLGYSNGGDATLFIEFMLEMVRDAILDYVAQRDDADDAEHDADGAKAPDASGLVFDNGAERSEEYLLGILRERPDVTIAQLCDLVSKSRRQVQRDIAALKSAGKVRRVGPNRGGHWEVP